MLKVQITAKIAKQEIKDITKKDWILDSVATHHFYADKAQFETLRGAEEEIKIANSKIIWSAGHGTVKLAVYISKDNQLNEMLLKEVIYASILDVNLLSSSALGDDLGLRCSLEPDKSSKIYHGRRPVANLVRRSNLYFVNLVEWEIEQAYKTATGAHLPAKPLSLWHRRLGHISKESIKALVKLFTGINIAEPIDGTEDRDQPCIPCIHDKQAKRPLKDKDNLYHHSEKLFELIHSDLKNPFPEAHDRS